MKQYIDLLKEIKEKGTVKPASRAGMPGTKSLFGYQYRHNLQEGFPLLTTKKVYWKGVAVELLWMIQGNTNVKYLIDNKVNIWNEDAYNYYVKYRTNKGESNILNFDEFVEAIKLDMFSGEDNYKFGDCGFQYGKVWRKWNGNTLYNKERSEDGKGIIEQIDQIKNVIDGLKNNPEGRRHIVTALDPANDNNLALYWCHSMFQFNCRPLSLEQRISIYDNKYSKDNNYPTVTQLNELNIPKYYLDCQLYQRSCDFVLGLSFNLASYSLLTEMFCKICNMIPGDFIHSFGDVHIYDNHQDAVNTQLEREPKALPNLKFSDNFNNLVIKYNSNEITLDQFFNSLSYNDFIIENYDPHPTIKAELSTGLIK